MKKLLSLSLLYLILVGGARSQCTTTISTFPYFEDFETASGTNWTAGILPPSTVASSWALSSPGKTKMPSASSGIKAWITNPLGKSNPFEQSAVTSPCFNFTAIPAPVIEMKVNWSTVLNSEAAVLQSSIDGGATWQVVGSFSDPADYFTSKWYTSNTITGTPGGQAATGAQGWTGFNASSSNGWVSTRHLLTGLGGQANVKLRVAFGSAASTAQDGFAFDDVKIHNAPANNAGISSITSPVPTVIPGNPTPITVTLRNFGSNALTSANIGFSVNGVVAPTTPSPYVYNGNLAFNATSAPITIGSYAFPAGVSSTGAYKIKAWSTSPNNTTDSDNANDTTTIFINACNTLSGNYTINQNLPASANNFISFASAMDALKTCGVSGPVTISVVSGTGPYIEQVTIPVISGTSATNTVTLEGNGNQITATPGLAAPSYLGTITFNGGDFVTLNNFIINVPTGATNGYGVQIINASNNITISNCTINVPMTSSSNTLNGIIAGTSPTATGDNTNNALIQGNIINGGNFGIRINGLASGGTTTGNRIIGNQVRDSYAQGIYIHFGTATIVEGNDISRPTRADVGAFTGISLGGTSNSCIISKNRIHNTHDAATSLTTAVNGIQVLTSATAGTENIIKNNLIYNINNNATIYGIYNSFGNGNYFYHNTVALDNPSWTGGAAGVARAYYATNAALSNIRLNNNVFTMNLGGTNAKHLIYITTNTSVIASNNNVLYISPTTSNAFTGFYNANQATLTDWRTANTTDPYDMSSVAADPVYVNLTTGNLKPTSATVNNIGLPVTPPVTDDITGATRSTTTPDAGACEFEPTANDAGIVAFVSPTSPVTPGSQPITVTIKNYGSNPLTSATITWTANTVTQPSFVWTGNLAPNQVSGSITIGNYNFTAGNHTVSVCTSLPNGAADANPANDCGSVAINSCNALAGNYTIDKNTAASSTNYTSFTAAAQALGNCGVSAPVTFTVASGSGTYNEQVELTAIPNASATNSVTFEGSNNTLTFSPNLAKPGVLILNGANYVKINNLNITVNAAATDGWGVQLLNAANNNILSNCTINLPLITSISSNMVGIGTGTATTAGGIHTSNSKFQNNTIHGGVYGIRLSGSTGLMDAVNNQVTGNTILDSYAYPLYLSNNDGTLVEGNDISRPTHTAPASFTGISVTGLSKNLVISKNKIHNAYGGVSNPTYDVFAISFSNASAPWGSENIIKNNLIYDLNTKGSNLIAFYNSGSDCAFYFHNTVNIDYAGATGNVRGFYQTGAVNNIKIINNIFSVKGGVFGNWHILYFNTSASYILSNNNVLNAGPGVKTGYFSGLDLLTLADWKTANSASYDQNSVYANPVFVSPGTGNLKPTSVGVNNLGQPLPAVTDDILGITRNTTTPDAGAYEFDVAANDVGITQVSGPNTTTCGLSNAETITVTIKNYGSNTQTTIPLSFSVNGPTIATENYTGSLAPNTTATFTFNAKANLAAAGPYVIIAKTQLTGDLVSGNDADTLNTTNSLLPALPLAFDFETPATGISRFRTVTNLKSNITEGAAASFGPGSAKGMIMDGGDTAIWVSPTGTIDPFTNNPVNFAGAYLCVPTAGGAASDSLWLTFDLKQLFKLANTSTNFRVTVNGTQIGTTYRPPFSGTGGTTNWTKVKINLSAYKNDPTVMIGLESAVKEAFANGVGTANLIDNINIIRRIKVATGVNANQMEARLHIFPNPGKGIFNVDLPQGKTYELTVTDLSGKVIRKQTAGSGISQLNLEGTAKGIYLLHVSGESGSAVRKLIVE